MMVISFETAASFSDFALNTYPQTVDPDWDRSGLDLREPNSIKNKSSSQSLEKWN